MQEAPDSPRRWCYGCGAANPEGLHIQFQIDGRRVTGDFAPRKAHQGFPGIAHGGIAAAAIDEAMGWAMYANGTWAVTARLEVKYRNPMPLDAKLRVTAEVTRERGRWLEAEAKLRDLDGPVIAEGKGVFIRLPVEEARRMERFFLAGRS